MGQCSGSRLGIPSSFTKPPYSRHCLCTNVVAHALKSSRTSAQDKKDLLTRRTWTTSASKHIGIPGILT